MKRIIKNPFRYKISAWEPEKHKRSRNSWKHTKEAFSMNKIIPSHLEKVFYSIILKYPELKETKISIREAVFYGRQHTLRALPPMLSIFRKRKNRMYRILVNKSTKAPVPFYSLPITKQKGIFAHELAHIADYNKRNAFQIIGLGFNLLFSKKFMKKFERYTDHIAIQKGFGSHLLGLRKHILNTEIFSYKKFHEKIYFSPAQIEEEIQNYLNLKMSPANNLF